MPQPLSPKPFRSLPFFSFAICPSDSGTGAPPAAASHRSEGPQQLITGFALDLGQNRLACHYKPRLRGGGRDGPHARLAGELAAVALAGAVMGGCSAAPLPRSLPEGPWRRCLRALPAESLHAFRQEGFIASRRPHPGAPARRPVTAARRRPRRRRRRTGVLGGPGRIVVLPGAVAPRVSAGARRPLKPGPVRPAA